MEGKKSTLVSTWSYTCKLSSGKSYHSREYATRAELAAVVSELIMRTPQKYTSIVIVRTDSWR